jgi:predicted nucleic acid-binding protein
MKRQKSGINRFLIDTNVFIASIKHPDRKTGSLDLILDLINNPDVCLVGNDLLLLEFEKYQKRFESPLAYKILKDLKHKIEFIEVRPESIKQCAKYIPHEEIVDIVHAATCLQTSAILISNDNHFNKLNESEVIEVWTISKAINTLVKTNK